MGINDVLMVSAVFFAIYSILKNFTDFLLKRKIIRAGHFESAGILNQAVTSEAAEASDVNKYPALKWGLVAFFGGLGFIVIDQMSPAISNQDNYRNFMHDSMLPFGIELVAISFGFILYFLIVNFIRKK
jgi:hypothetical protein